MGAKSTKKPASKKHQKAGKAKKSTLKCIPAKVTKPTTKCFATVRCEQAKKLMQIETSKYPPPKVAFPLFYVLLIVAVIFYTFFCRCSQIRRAPRRPRVD